MTVFVTTHYMEEAEYCDRLGLIYRGELIALGTPAELKTNLMREESSRSTATAAGRHGGAGGRPGVKEAALFGTVLHVSWPRTAARTHAVAGVLEQNDFSVRRLEHVTPSLEDVFVSLIEARDRQIEPVAEVRR